MLCVLCGGGIKPSEQKPLYIIIGIKKASLKRVAFGYNIGQELFFSDSHMKAVLHRDRSRELFHANAREGSSCVATTATMREIFVAVTNGTYWIYLNILFLQTAI